jgi:hypothetical protein
MAKKNDLTADEILARVDSFEAASYGINDSSLTADRAEAFRFYNGEKFGNELEGRSQVVSRDVLDVIESALPQLLKVFVSGDEVARFIPRGPEDEEAAEQETMAVNYYTTEKNDGFSIFYTWFKDALLSKNGYVKVWWEEEDETETESYQGLTDEQLVLLLQDERIEVVEHTAYPDPIDQQQKEQAIQELMAQGQQEQVQQLMMQPPKSCHDVKIEITETKGCIKIDNVAPEDMLVSVDTKTVSLHGANFVQHRSLMTANQIEEQGWKVPESAEQGNESWLQEEVISRNLYNEREENKGIDQFLVKDTYINLDGDLMRVVIIGNEIVEQEDAEVIPFVCITPMIMPHRHIGMSYSDLTKDIQIIKSTLLRGQLDAMYLANSPRWAVSDRVNLDDMLTSRPGGVVRVQGEPGSALFPLQSPPAPTTGFSLIEYLDRAKGTRTGISEQMAGIDANALNKTAMQANILQNNAQERISLVARTFANTGVKDLFMLVHRMVRKYNTRPEIIRIAQKWVTVDPREWKERKDMSVSVGLGTGNKDQQLAHLMTILQAQREAIQIGVATPQNIYHALKKLTQNAGFKSPEEFWTDPGEGPVQPPENPQLAIKKMELEADAQKFQAQTQVDQQEADKASQMEMQKFQAQVEIDQRQAEQLWQQEQLRSQNDVEIERDKIRSQAELEMWKAKLNAETQILLEQIKAQNGMKLAAFNVNAAKEGETLTEMGDDGTERPTSALAGLVEAINNNLGSLLMSQQQLMAHIARPKRIVRGADGRVAGVE